LLHAARTSTRPTSSFQLGDRFKSRAPSSTLLGPRARHPPRGRGLARRTFTVLGNQDRFKPHGITTAAVLTRSASAQPNYVSMRGGMGFVVVDSSAGTHHEIPSLPGCHGSRRGGKTPHGRVHHIPPGAALRKDGLGPIQGARADSGKAPRVHGI